MQSAAPPPVGRREKHGENPPPRLAVW